MVAHMEIRDLDPTGLQTKTQKCTVADHPETSSIARLVTVMTLAGL